MSLTADQPSDKSEAEYLGGVIKRVGNFSMDTLEDRKKFQKTVYLIQAFDIDLGYTFSWYLYGVYSPALADVGFKLTDIYDEVTESQFSNPETEQRFGSFLDFIQPLKDDVERLEISSSLHFLSKNNPELQRDVLIEYLLDEKDLESGFDECWEEWVYLEDYGLMHK